jgi:hypothetical protein
MLPSVELIAESRLALSEVDSSNFAVISAIVLS